MKLYKTQTAPRWHSFKAGLKNFEEVELPKEGRQGMADFLNANDVEAQFLWDKQQHPQDYDPLEAAELRAVEASQPPKTDTDFQERRAAAVAMQQDTSALIDWLLDEAQPWQLERMFEALASRLHQLFRG